MAAKVHSNTKMYYSMGEVCEMFDLPASTIRFWEKTFSQIKPRKNAKGNRMFTPEDIETLKVIYHLVKEKGMTLSGADKFLKDKKTAARSEMDIVEILQSMKSKLLAIKEEISFQEKQAIGEIIIDNYSEDEISEEEVISVTEIIQKHGTDKILAEIEEYPEESTYDKNSAPAEVESSDIEEPREVEVDFTSQYISSSEPTQTESDSSFDHYSSEDAYFDFSSRDKLSKEDLTDDQSTPHEDAILPADSDQTQPQAKMLDLFQTADSPQSQQHEEDNQSEKERQEQEKIHAPYMDTLF